MPTDVKRWAKHYGWTVKKFRNECEKLSWVGLPLWSFAVETPLEIESMGTAKTKLPLSVSEFASVLIHQPEVGPETAPMLNAMVAQNRRRA